MRLLGFLLATLAITNVVAEDTFCVKYAKAVFSKNDTTLTGADEYNLISAVVARVIVGCDNTVANQFGVPNVGTGPFRFYANSTCNTGATKVAGLVSDANNAPFFAGTAPNYNSQTNLQLLNDAAGLPLNTTFPSIRFVGVSGQNVLPNPAATGTSTSQGLIQHLVSFFGRDLGCKFYDTVNPTPSNGSFIGAYQGNTNMAAVHAKMNITKTVWMEFVITFRDTLLSFGVQQADITGTVIPYVQKFLLGAADNNQICNDPATCLCAPLNGQSYINQNGTCVLNGTSTTTSPPTGATTAPPAGNGTTSPPTKAAASIIGTSVATIVAMIAALLLAFL